MGKFTGKELEMIVKCWTREKCNECEYYTAGCDVRAGNEKLPCYDVRVRRKAIVQLYAEHLRNISDLKILASECAKNENCYSCQYRVDKTCVEFFKKYKMSPEKYYNEVK